MHGKSEFKEGVIIKTSYNKHVEKEKNIATDVSLMNERIHLTTTP